MRNRTAIGFEMDEFQWRAIAPVLQGVVMKKIVSALGLMIALALGGIAWIGFPGGSDVMADEGRVAAATCAQAPVSLDEGYGVTRQLQRDCAKN